MSSTEQAGTAITIHRAQPVSLGGGSDPRALDALARVVAEAKGCNKQSALLSMALAESVGLSLGQCINDVHVINGKPTLSANAQLMLARRAGVRTRWVRHDADVAHLRLWLPGDPEPVDEVFTMDDARSAGLLGNATWKKFPRNMLVARCAANAVRFHCPEVLGGTVYDPDEMGGVEAHVVDVTPDRTHDDERHPGVAAGGRLLTGEERARIQDAIGDVLGYVEEEIGCVLADWTTAEAKAAKPMAERIRRELEDEERRALGGGEE